MGGVSAPRARRRLLCRGRPDRHPEPAVRCLAGGPGAGGPQARRRTCRERTAPRGQGDIAMRAVSLALLGLIRGYQLLISPMFPRSEEHTSELQSLMRISYAVFCLKKKKKTT